MNVKDVMTPTPTCVAPGTSLSEAARLMKDTDVGALPVCSQDRLAGMITDRDIAMRAVAECCDPETTTVADAMTPGVITCSEDDDVEAAASVMEEKQVRRLPVLDRDQRLVGIVSLGDIATRVRDGRLSGELLERVSEPG